MSAYYGAAYGGGMVLCHRITVKEYERKLPNGKTIIVKGYTREGDPVQDAARAGTNYRYNKQYNESKSRASYQAKNAIQNYRNAVEFNKAASGMPDGNSKKILSSTAEYYKKRVGTNVKNAAGAVGDMAKAKYQQAKNNAVDAISDAKEILSANVGNLVEMVRYGAAYAGAYGSEAAKKVAAAAKRAYEAGKSFIDNLLGKVKDIAKSVSEKAQRAVSGAKQVAGRVQDKVTNNDYMNRDRNRGKVTYQRK